MLFTCVCLSTEGGVHPLGRHPPPPLGRQTPPPARQPPPKTATAADGTHATGINSCLNLWYSKAVGMQKLGACPSAHLMKLPQYFFFSRNGYFYCQGYLVTGLTSILGSAIFTGFPAVLFIFPVKFVILGTKEIF